MDPKTHTWTSGLGALIFGAVNSLGPVEMLGWILVASLAGFLIDIDHFLIIYIKGDREALKWLKTPLKLYRHPDLFLEESGLKGNTGIYRMTSHLSILVVLYLSLSSYKWFLPAFIGVAVHVFLDLIWDISTNFGFVEA